jgi:hypothetical protein
MSPHARRLAALALAAAGLAVTSCDASAPGTPAGSPTVGYVPARDGGDSGELSVDAAGETLAAPTLQGSPLCNAAATSCYPDHATTAKACGEAPDGGPYSPTGGYDNAVFACRVVATPQGATNGTQNPTCAPAGTAGDGSWCKSASECEPAFDCVGSGTCQQYCCSGNDECVADQFCDIQRTVASPSVEVPVCMPIHPASGCNLLDPATCPASETCAVVRDNGATSCVSVGAATAGKECDTEHCAAGLVCLGTSGSRTCSLLCSTSATGACPGSQQCSGGLPLFPDPTDGICSPVTTG